MDTSRFLAKVIGLYFMILGLLLVVRRSALADVFQGFAESPPLVFFAGVFSLVIGLLLVVSHNRWTADWTVLITLLGWLMVLGGLVRLFLPSTVMQLGLAMGSGAGVLVYGIVLIAIGGFLGYKGLRA